MRLTVILKQAEPLRRPTIAEDVLSTSDSLVARLSFLSTSDLEKLRAALEDTQHDLKRAERGPSTDSNAYGLLIQIVDLYISEERKES